MNQPIDEQSLQDYLRRGSEYSARYREVGADEVPPELDRAVIAQATSAAKVTTLPLRNWRRYSVPMTLAATLVIAVTVVVNVSQSPTTFEPTITAPDIVTTESVGVASNVELQQAPAPESPAPVEVDAFGSADRHEASTKAGSEPSAQAATVALEKREVSRQDSQERSKLESKEIAQRNMTPDSRAASIAAAAPAVSAPPPAVEQAPGTVDGVVVTGAFIRQLPQDAAIPVEVISSEDLNHPQAVRAGPRNNVPASKAAGLSDRERAAERESDPNRWLEYIRSLRSVGRNVDANREWERFVKAYPNYAVAHDDAARNRK